MEQGQKVPLVFALGPGEDIRQEFIWFLWASP